MLVELKYDWFAPTESNERDVIFKTSGQRYKRGVHEMPDELRESLPKTAIILNRIPDPIAEPEPSTNPADYDQERKDADHVIKVAEEAEQALKEQRQANMAKARAAKKEKAKQKD